MESKVTPTQMRYPIGEPISSYSVSQGKELSLPSETERRLNEAQEIARIGSWELDVRTNEISWSPESFRLFGFDPSQEEPSVETIHDRFHPDDCVALETLVDRAIRQGISYDTNVRHFRDDGSFRWLHLRGRAILGQEGQVVRLVGIVQDITDQKTVEQVQQHILRSARCILWTSDIASISPGSLEWFIISFSEAAAKSFLPLEQLPGETYLEALFRSREIENDFEPIHTSSREHIERGEGYSQDFKVRSKQGKVLWVHEEVNIETISPGNWRATGVMTDITEQKEAELLRQHIMRSARCILWTAEINRLSNGWLDWGVHTLSDEASESFLPVTRLPGESYHEALSRIRNEENDDIERIHWESAVCVLQGRGYSNSYKVRNSYGSIVWLREDVTIETISADQWRAIGVTTDVTERMESQERVKAGSEERKREREFLRSIIDASSDGIFVMNADNVFTLVNQHLANYHGLPVEQLLGKRVDDFVHDPASIERINEYKFKALASPNTTFTYDERLVFGTDVFWSQTMQRAIPSLDGERYEVLVISTDITERKFNEERLEEANRQLLRATEEAESARDAANAANNAKSEFLANMSHEIRTPMNGVLGMTQLLGYTSMTAEQQDYVATLQQSAEALLVVIDDILDFSKLEAGKVELHPGDFNFLALISEVVALMDPCATKKGLTLGISIAPDIPTSVFGDSGRVRQVLLNLLGNALKFTEAGTISLRCQRILQSTDAFRVRVEVRDTGPGISFTDQMRLFQSFSQVDSSATRRFGGTGLGLAISKQLIELMGGSIGVHSSPGSGSTFWFELPFQQAEAAAPDLMY